MIEDFDESIEWLSCVISSAKKYNDIDLTNLISWYAGFIMATKILIEKKKIELSDLLKIKEFKEIFERVEIVKNKSDKRLSQKEDELL